MDKASKTKIKHLVLKLRHLLEGEVELGLKPLGIFTERDWLPENRLPRQDEKAQIKRARITAIIQAAMDQGYTRREASAEYIRRSALTYLIWLVGLKCLEARHLIDEVITTRVEYGGRSLFHRDFRYAHPDLAAQPDDALPATLEAACHLATQQIRELFDPDSDWSIVWPRYNTLKEAIVEINNIRPVIWSEDEIVGWVYQFYRIKDRDQVRQRGRPQKVDDVAAINQFYTPRWIVRFLVDNTLGRLWLEMHPSSCVRQKCSYLVPTADLPGPDDEPTREAKSPWEIRLLDPACGTMHFAFYASEVFLEMYQETQAGGWVDELPDGQPVSDLTEARMVSLIFRYNLFGITIDLWATRLATLSLYMKLKTLNLEAEVIGMNVIRADAHLPREMRQQFLEEFANDQEMQEALREIFATMGDIGQIGSLFRPKEQLLYILNEKKHPTAKWEEQKRLAVEKGQIPVRQMELGEITGPDAGWRVFRELDKVLEKLQEFARLCWVQQNYAGYLLAVKTEENLRLLDILMQPYDIVVMNPPYGKTTNQAAQYLCKMYPLTHHNLYAAFLERSLELITPQGYVGALTSSTFLYLSEFEKLREKVILRLSRIRVILDLGSEILDDATVDTAAVVLRKVKRDSTAISQQIPISIFFRLYQYGDLREQKFQDLVRELSLKLPSQDIFLVYQESFSSLPGKQFAYWTPQTFISMFQTLPAIDPLYASVRNGIKTGADEIFLRLWWEVSSSQIGSKKRWVFFANGGSYSKYYNDIETVVLWDKTGEKIISYSNKKGQINSRVRPENKNVYFNEGITYQFISSKGFNAKYLSSESLFGVAGSSIFPSGKLPLFAVLGMINSSTVQFLLKIFVPSRVYQVSYVRKIPFPRNFDISYQQKIAKLACEAYNLKAAWDTGNEICTRFTTPWLLQLANTDGEAFENGLREMVKLLDWQGLAYPIILEAILAALEKIEQTADAKLQQLQAQIDEAVYELYEINPADRALIERELGERPPELIWPQTEGKARAEKGREHVRRLLSYFVLQALKMDEDGIVPLVEGTGQTTVLTRLREGLETTFTSEVAFNLEDEARHILGKPVEQWLGRDFSIWHTKLYKNRPILWHLASPQGTFSTLVYYHKLDKDTLPKVRNVYLWTLRDGLHKQLVRAREAKDNKTIDRLEAALDDLTVFDERLGRVIEAGYDPVIDDGVKANILPLQEAGVVRNKI